MGAIGTELRGPFGVGGACGWSYQDYKTMSSFSLPLGFSPYRKVTFLLFSQELCRNLDSWR